MRAFRVTTGGLMFVVAFIALLGGLVFRVLEDDVELRKEVRARLAVVDEIDGSLREADRQIQELSARIDNSDRQPILHPDHRAWVASLAGWRATRKQLEGLRPRYSRLTWCPWIDFLPDSRFGETYRQAFQAHSSPINAQAFERGYRQWRMKVALLISSVIGGLLAMVGGFLAGRGTPSGTGSRAFAKVWLPRLSRTTSASQPAKRDR